MLGPRLGDPGFRFLGGEPFRLYRAGKMTKAEAGEIAKQVRRTHNARVVKRGAGRYVIYRSFWDKTGRH